MTTLAPLAILAAVILAAMHTDDPVTALIVLGGALALAATEPRRRRIHRPGGKLL